MSGLAASEQLPPQEQHCNHTIPAWNHRAGSSHPLQLLGGVGSTLSPRALGAPHPHLDTHELALHIPANISAGKRAQKPSPRWASPVMNQTGSKAGAACPSCHPSVPPATLCPSQGVTRARGTAPTANEGLGELQRRRSRSQQGRSRTGLWRALQAEQMLCRPSCAQLLSGTCLGQEPAAPRAQPWLGVQDGESSAWPGPALTEQTDTGTPHLPLLPALIQPPFQITLPS